MMSESTLDPQVAQWIRRSRLDSVDGAFEFDEGEDLVKPGLGFRRRTRVTFADEDGRPWECYLKRYGPIPSVVLLRRVLCGEGRACEAVREFRAIRAVRQAGVPTMRELSAGAEMTLLGARRSFLLVGAVPGDALERTAEDFLTRHAGAPDMRCALTDELVSLVRTFHQAGFVHRDLYAAHVFLYEHDGRIDLHLIDLARVFRPRWRVFRWRVKDLAQLKYSMPSAWVDERWRAFLMGYLQSGDEEEIDRWDRAITRKVTSMTRRQQRRARRAGGRA